MRVSNDHKTEIYTWSTWKCSICRKCLSKAYFSKVSWCRVVNLMLVHFFCIKLTFREVSLFCHYFKSYYLSQPVLMYFAQEMKKCLFLTCRICSSSQRFPIFQSLFWMWHHPPKEKSFTLVLAVGFFFFGPANGRHVGGDVAEIGGRHRSSASSKMQVKDR